MTKLLRMAFMYLKNSFWEPPYPFYCVRLQCEDNHFWMRKQILARHCVHQTLCPSDTVCIRHRVYQHCVHHTLCPSALWSWISEPLKQRNKFLFFIKHSTVLCWSSLCGMKHHLTQNFNIILWVHFLWLAQHWIFKNDSIFSPFLCSSWRFTLSLNMDGHDQPIFKLNEKFLGKEVYRGKRRWKIIYFQRERDPAMALFRECLFISLNIRSSWLCLHCLYPIDMS